MCRGPGSRRVALRHIIGETDMTSYSTKKQGYQKAVDAAMQWVTGLQRADGGFDRLESMSNTMVAGASLLFCGRPEAASRLIAWQRAAYGKPEGGFDAPEIRAGRASSLAERQYAPAWMIYSAHTNLAFDISLRAMPGMLAFQDPATGGVFGRAEEAESGAGIVNSAVTAVACQAALTTGNLEAARRMGDHLVDRVIAQNPALDKAFYPVWETGRGLRTDADTPSSGNMPAVITRGAPNQHLHLAGATIAVLSDLHAVTKDARYLDGALRVFEFVVGAAPEFVETSLAHKLAWGCAWLYRETGNARCIEVACRVVDYLLTMQDDDGSFVHRAIVSNVDAWPHGSRVNTTVQFALWIHRAAACL